ELLALHVPGFFLVDDQDDTITAVRGLAPDNNSKLMLLLDGQPLNAEWFWGPPDAVLNGLDLEVFERIEVVRGPGSVTLGQGALLGVVNLVTRRDAPGFGASLVLGERGRRAASARWEAAFGDDGLARLHVGRGRHDGASVPDEGLARQADQGLTVHERGHRLYNGEHDNVLATIEYGPWHFRGFHFHQSRDLYAWRRDREVVEQRLNGMELGWSGAMARGRLDVTLNYQNDEYMLSSHARGARQQALGRVPGLVMGGHREVRQGARLVWRSDADLESHALAIGMEANRYVDGLRNADGDNFLANGQDLVLREGRDALSERNRWALPNRTIIRSLFAEDQFGITEHWEGYVAARWDDHPYWGSRVSPRVALLWSATGRQQWRLSYQRGFRGAVGVHYGGGFEGDGLLREMNFAALEGNPWFPGAGGLQAVRPETLRSLELAWTLRWSPDLRLSVVGFANRVEDVIGVGALFIDDPARRAQAVAAQARIGTDRIGDWGGVFYFQNNDGSLSHYGLESALDWFRDDLGVRVRASHAYVTVNDASAGQFGPGNIYVGGRLDDPEPRSFPGHTLRVQAAWRPAWFDDRLGLTYTHLHHGRWSAPLGGTIADEHRQSGGDLGNLALDLSWPRASGFSLTLEVKNLWNERALMPATTVAGEESALASGFPSREPRSVWLSLRYGRAADERE
ncbi:MAG: TonB-dependent receptor plug domain-containing protein, partial [Silanimonas sp.]